MNEINRNRTKMGYLTIKGKKYYVYEGLNPIGRNKEATVIIKDVVSELKFCKLKLTSNLFRSISVVITKDFAMYLEAISHNHSVLTIVNDNEHFISDFNSSNGTFINSEKMAPFNLYKISDDSKILFSNTILGTYKKLQKSSTVLEESALQNTQFVDDSFYMADTQIFNDTANISTNFKNVAHTSTQLNTKRDSSGIDTIPDDGFDFGTVSTQINDALTQIKNIKPNLSIHNMETQQMCAPESIPKCRNAAFSIPDDGLDFNSVDTQVTIQPNALSIHDMATQLIYKPGPSGCTDQQNLRNSFENLKNTTPVNKLTDENEINDLETQLMLQASSTVLEESALQNTQFVDDSFYMADTQIFNDTANISTNFKNVAHTSTQLNTKRVSSEIDTIPDDGLDFGTVSTQINDALTQIKNIKPNLSIHNMETQLMCPPESIPKCRNAAFSIPDDGLDFNSVDTQVTIQPNALSIHDMATQLICKPGPSGCTDQKNLDNSFKNLKHTTPVNELTDENEINDLETQLMVNSVDLTTKPTQISNNTHAIKTPINSPLRNADVEVTPFDISPVNEFTDENEINDLETQLMVNSVDVTTNPTQISINIHDIETPINSPLRNADVEVTPFDIHNAKTPVVKNEIDISNNLKEPSSGSDTENGSFDINTAVTPVVSPTSIHPVIGKDNEIIELSNGSDTEVDDLETTKRYAEQFPTKLPQASCSDLPRKGKKVLAKRSLLSFKKKNVEDGDTNPPTTSIREISSDSSDSGAIFSTNVETKMVQSGGDANEMSATKSSVLNKKSTGSDSDFEERKVTKKTKVISDSDTEFEEVAVCNKPTRKSARNRKKKIEVKDTSSSDTDTEIPVNNANFSRRTNKSSKKIQSDSATDVSDDSIIFKARRSRNARRIAEVSSDTDIDNNEEIIVSDRDPGRLKKLTVNLSRVQQLKVDNFSESDEFRISDCERNSIKKNVSRKDSMPKDQSSNDSVDFAKINVQVNPDDIAQVKLDFSPADSDRQSLIHTSQLTRKSKSFINSDTEDDINDTVDNNAKIVAEDSDTDVDDSFVKPNNFINLDCTDDVIPSTQDVVTNEGKSSSEESFKLGLTEYMDGEQLGIIEEITEISTNLNQIYDLEDSKTNQEDQSGTHLNVETSVPIDENISIDDSIFSAPTQRIFNRSTKINQSIEEHDSIFELATQKVVDNEGDSIFEIATQKITDLSDISANEGDSIFEMATQKICNVSKKSGNISTLNDTDDFDFAAPTQKIMGDDEEIKAGNSIFDFATQKIDTGADSNEDSVFLAATQKLDCAESGSDEDIFMVATQKLPDLSANTIEKPAKKRNSSKKRVTFGKKVENISDDDYNEKNMKEILAKNCLKTKVDTSIIDSDTIEEDLKNIDKKMPEYVETSIENVSLDLELTIDSVPSNINDVEASTNPNEKDIFKNNTGNKDLSIQLNTEVDFNGKTLPIDQTNLKDVVTMNGEKGDPGIETQLEVMFETQSFVEPDLSRSSKPIDISNLKDLETVPAEKGDASMHEPGIESQLEVMFATQSFVEPDSSRPSNPIAQLLTVPTQDILDTPESDLITKKRPSSESDFEVNFKRAKKSSNTLTGNDGRRKSSKPGSANNRIIRRKSVDCGEIIAEEKGNSNISGDAQKYNLNESMNSKGAAKKTIVDYFQKVNDSRVIDNESPKRLNLSINKFSVNKMNVKERTSMTDLINLNENMVEKAHVDKTNVLNLSNLQTKTNDEIDNLEDKSVDVTEADIEKKQISKASGRRTRAKVVLDKNIEETQELEQNKEQDVFKKSKSLNRNLNKEHVLPRKNTRRLIHDEDHQKISVSEENEIKKDGTDDEDQETLGVIQKIVPNENNINEHKTEDNNSGTSNNKNMFGGKNTASTKIIVEEDIPVPKKTRGRKVTKKLDKDESKKKSIDIADKNISSTSKSIDTNNKQTSRSTKIRRITMDEDAELFEDIAASEIIIDGKGESKTNIDTIDKGISLKSKSDNSNNKEVGRSTRARRITIDEDADFPVSKNLTDDMGEIKKKQIDTSDKGNSFISKLIDPNVKEETNSTRNKIPTIGEDAELTEECFVDKDESKSKKKRIGITSKVINTNIKGTVRSSRARRNTIDEDEDFAALKKVTVDKDESKNTKKCGDTTGKGNSTTSKSIDTHIKEGVRRTRTRRITIDEEKTLIEDIGVSKRITANKGETKRIPTSDEGNPTSESIDTTIEEAERSTRVKRIIIHEDAELLEDFAISNKINERKTNRRKDTTVNKTKKKITSDSDNDSDTFEMYVPSKPKRYKVSKSDDIASTSIKPPAKKGRKAKVPEKVIEQSDSETDQSHVSNNSLQESDVALKEMKHQPTSSSETTMLARGRRAKKDPIKPEPSTSVILESANISKAPAKRGRKAKAVVESSNESDASSSVVTISSTPKKKKLLDLDATCLLSTPERAKRQLKPKVVFTMLESPELETVIRFLGGSIVDTVDACTVLVTKNILRSQKLLCAVAQGKPICTPDWLNSCKKAQKFLDPWEHLILDVEAEKKWNFSLEESLSKSRNRKMYEGYSFQLMVTKAVDVLKGAIENCGGKCVARAPKCTENFIVISVPENKSKYSKFLKQNIKVIAAEAIFDGVLRQEIVFDKHLLN